VAAGRESVAEVRGRGLMVGIEFADRTEGTDSPATDLRPRPDLARALLAAAFERNLLLLTCGVYGEVVRVIPPLVTTGAEIDLAISILGESLATL